MRQHRSNSAVVLLLIPAVCVPILWAHALAAGPTATARRTRGATVVAPADWPAVLAVWTEVNVFPDENQPHPKLTANLRAAREWGGIATHWIIVNHHTRVDTPKKRKLFWGHARDTLAALGIQLVPGLKIHDEIHPWSVEQIVEESKTGAWATRLVDYADGLHREFGFPIIAADWETFGKLATKAGIDGDHFGLIRPAFQRAAESEWRFWHWVPGLDTARYEYREREVHDPTWRAARVRWNFARGVFNSPRDRLLVGNDYWSVPRWGTATETRFDPAIERGRSHRSLGIHNVIEGFTCAARRTLHNGDPTRRYLLPREIVEMPAWKHSDEVFLFVKRDQAAEAGWAFAKLSARKSSVVSEN